MPEPGSVELFEREPSLGAIDSALAKGRACGGTALLIEGPAGIGKTALLEEAQGRARVRGVARGRWRVRA
jgi:predicted ATPase